MGNEKDAWLRKVLGAKVDRQPGGPGGGGPGKEAAERQTRVTQLRDRRKKLQAEYDKVAAQKPPDEVARDLGEKLAVIKELLADTSKDAAKRAKEIQDYVKKAKEAAPKDKKLAAALDKVAGPIGKIGKGVGNAAKVMNELAEKVETAQKLVQFMEKNFETAEAGSAADQLRQFKEMFDTLRKKVPGIDEMPGVSQMFQVYSEAIGAIAERASFIEGIVRQRNEMGRDAGLGDVYIRPKSARERLAEQRNALEKRIAETDQQLHDERADEPAEAPLFAKDEVTRRNCEKLCDTPEKGGDWVALSTRAADAEDEARRAHEGLGLVPSAQEEITTLTQEMDGWKQELPKHDAKLAGIEGEPADPPRSRHDDGPITIKAPKADRLAKARTERAALVNKIDKQARLIEDKQKEMKALQDWAQRTAEQAKAARDEANRAKARHEACLRECYRTAIERHEIAEMPAELR